jgi:hypothetical protein
MPKLFYCDHHAIPLPDGHKFPIEKYRLVREILDGRARSNLSRLRSRRLNTSSVSMIAHTWTPSWPVRSRRLPTDGSGSPPPRIDQTHTFVSGRDARCNPARVGRRLGWESRGRHPSRIPGGGFGLLRLQRRCCCDFVGAQKFWYRTRGGDRFGRPSRRWHRGNFQWR